MKSFLLCIITIILVRIAYSQSSGITTYCNPIDVNYQYNFEQINEGISYRSGADPVIVNHGGEYYLFLTISGGWWHSKDLIHWNYIVPDKWPFEDMCAPAAISVGDTLFLFQSTFGQRPILSTTTPWSGHLEFYNRWMPLLPDTIGPWDPALFYDEDTKRWFMYFGSSNVYPLYGIELDERKRLAYKDKNDTRKLLYLDPENHGWERFGPDHRCTIKPFIEGAWMTKYKDKYYLQYAAPGTEYNVYANGTYIGDDPLDPFTYASYNPISYRPGGFMKGTGHGNTFKDNHGNFWNTGTPWVAVNWNFERRAAMFPAGFDTDDQMFVNTRFGDFPHYIPTEKWQNKDELFTGWMLLSYKKPCSASSVRDTFDVSNLTDENVRSFWVAESNSPAEWVIMDLEDRFEIRALQVNYTDYKSNIYQSDSTVYTQFRISVSTDKNNWQKIADLTTEKKDRSNAYIELTKPVQARYVRYEHSYVTSPNLAISDIRIFGKGFGKLPATPSGLVVRRDSDPRNAFISWNKVNNVIGYNILWGIKKEKLYQTYQVFGDEKPFIELRALNVGQDYFFKIEAFNENGVSKISDVIHCK